MATGDKLTPKEELRRKIQAQRRESSGGANKGAVQGGNAQENNVRDLNVSKEEKKRRLIEASKRKKRLAQRQKELEEMDLDLGTENPEEYNVLASSFLAPYLQDFGYTDLSYNGTQFRVQHNTKGRFMPKEQPTREEVENFVKQIANVKGLKFTVTNPVLDTEIGFLRVNAMHEKISPDGLTMALRISRPQLAIRDLDELTMGNGDLIERLLHVLVHAEQNLIISGRTGTGKTELQKKIIGYTTNDSKITLVEDTRDSHIKTIYPQKDINSWQTVEGVFDMSDAVRSALRNNPDWTIIAETRGAVSADILDSAKTDHAIITTIHASNAMGIPARLIPMIRQSDAYARTSDTIIGSEIVEFLRFGIQLRAERLGGKMVRYIREIAEFTEYTEQGTKGNTLYEYYNEYDPETQTYTGKQNFGTLSPKTIRVLEERRLIHLLPKIFNPRYMKGKDFNNLRPEEQKDLLHVPGEMPN